MSGHWPCLRLIGPLYTDEGVSRPGFNFLACFQRLLHVFWLLLCHPVRFPVDTSSVSGGSDVSGEKNWWVLQSGTPDLTL